MSFSDTLVQQSITSTQQQKRIIFEQTLMPQTEDGFIRNEAATTYSPLISGVGFRGLEVSYNQVRWTTNRRKSGFLTAALYSDWFGLAWAGLMVGMMRFDDDTTD